MIALLNATTYDFNTFSKNQYIIFDQEIIEKGHMTEYINKDYKEIDLKNKLVMPGLINGHSHIYSTFSRGLSVPYNPNNFKEILKQLWWKLDRNIDNQTTYYSGIVSGVEYLKHGVTSLIDHHASGEVINSLETLKKAVTDEIGLRGIYCFESSDRFNIEDCIKENKTFHQLNQTTKSRGLFGMHAQFTLSDQSLKKIKQESNNPVHIHIAESKMDQDLCLKQYNKRVIERLNDYNLITKNSLLVHGLYLNEKELKIIKEKEAVIALNVTSNMNNGVGLPNYQNFLKHNIKVIIGNDGISSSIAQEYRNLFFAMHHLDQSPKGFTYNDLIKIINNTYEYTSELLNTKLGRIEKGYQADLLIIELSNISPINSESIFGNLLFGEFQDFTPNDVFIAGKHILKNKQVNNNLQTKYKEAQTICKALWEKIEKEGNL